MNLTGDFGKIAISILSRSNSDDYWDGNWLYASIKINVPSFTADYKCNLRTDEFATFYKKLDELSSNKNKTAFFSSIEEGLSLKFERDITGIFAVNGEAKNIGNYKSSLLFEFGFDLSQLESFKQDIHIMLQKFPIIGAP